MVIAPTLFTTQPELAAHSETRRREISAWIEDRARSCRDNRNVSSAREYSEFKRRMMANIRGKLHVPSRARARAHRVGRQPHGRDMPSDVSNFPEAFDRVARDRENHERLTCFGVVSHRASHSTFDVRT